MKLTAFLVCFRRLNKLFIFLILLSIGFSNNLFSQNVAVTDNDGYTAASSAMLDVYSLNKGMLVPRLDSTQRVSISSPAQGLLVFDTTKNSFMYFNGSNWITIPSMSNNIVADGKALFAVTNAAGDTVFAVYNDGVKVTVDEGSKGTVGGFAVSGRTPTKGAEAQYFRVTPDSTRIYINDTAAVKGTVGGFAISGRTPTKTGEFDYLTVTPDSTRVYVNEGFTKGTVGGFAISGRTPTKTGPSLHSYFLSTTDSTRVYINDTSTSKGTVGGFAISGRTPTKGSGDYFNVSGNMIADTIYPSEPRIAWYPNKEAFMAGRVLVQYPDSVGLNSSTLGFESKAYGDYSQAFGYRSMARGDYSTAIGYQAIAHKNNSFSFGYNAIAHNTNSYAFGESAQAKGISSYAFGKSSTANGGSSFAFGDGSTTAITATNSFAIGQLAQANATYSYALGRKAAANGGSSYAFGDSATTSSIATNSFAFGDGAKAQNIDSYSFGAGAKSTGLGSYSIGSVGRDTLGNQTGVYTEASGNYSLAIGQGSKSTKLGSMSFGISNTSSGKYSLAMGTQSSVTGDYGIVIGSFASVTGSNGIAIGIFGSAGSGALSLKGGTASGVGSTAIGDGASSTGEKSVTISAPYFGGYSVGFWGAEAISLGSVAIGSVAKASGLRSIAIGHGSVHSDGYPVHYFGDYTEATGDYAIALGSGVTAQAYASLVVGRYNVASGTTTSWQSAEPLFVIGNGTAYNARSNAFTILKNGNTGINTDQPTHALDVRGPVRILNGGTNDVWIQGGSATWGDDRNLAILGFTDASYDVLVINHQSEYAGGTEINGHVIVNANLGAAASLTSSGFKVYKNTSSDAAVGFVNGSNTKTADGLYITAGQTTWTDPGAKLIKFFRYDGTEIGNVRQNTSTTVIYTTSSDLRLKENITDTKFGVSDLMNIKVRDFNFINDANKQRMTGFIAQELFNIYPDAVCKSETEEGTWQVDYGRITPLLVKAIQDQQKQIMDLTEKNKEIESLKAELETIKTLLNTK